MRTTYALPRPWSVAPLLVLVIAFVAFAVPPYLTLDPAQSRIPIAGTAIGYYPMLVAHVIFGAVAILTCCLQLWPWLRVRSPDVHRRIGLTYVFAGVLPAGVLGPSSARRRRSARCCVRATCSSRSSGCSSPLPVTAPAATTARRSIAAG